MNVRHKKGSICFSDDMKTVLKLKDMLRLHHDKETIEVTLLSGVKCYLRYYSEVTARRDFSYTLVALKRAYDETKTYV